MSTLIEANKQNNLASRLVKKNVDSNFSKIEQFKLFPKKK